MRFSNTRKALVGIGSKNLRADFERMLALIERASDAQKTLAGHRATRLISLTVKLQKTLSAKTRTSILAAFLADSERANLAHQWERKKDYECGPADDCSKPSPTMTCFRDTSEDNSCFTVPTKLLPAHWQ